MTLDDLANRLLHQLVGVDFISDGADLPENAVMRPRERWGPPPCSITTAPSCAGSCSRRAARRAMWRFIARALGIPAGRAR